MFGLTPLKRKSALQRSRDMIAQALERQDARMRSQQPGQGYPTPTYYRRDPANGQPVSDYNTMRNEIRGSGQHGSGPSNHGPGGFIYAPQGPGQNVYGPGPASDYHSNTSRGSNQRPGGPGNSKTVFEYSSSPFNGFVEICGGMNPGTSIVKRSDGNKAFSRSKKR